MSRSRPFAQVDVFSQVPYLGNPVAVVLDGYRVSQGTRLGRVGDITVTADTDGSVWGGRGDDDPAARDRPRVTATARAPGGRAAQR